MRLMVFGLMSLLLLALPSSAFADFGGIVYNIPGRISENQIDIDSQILSHITDTVKLYENPYMEQTVVKFSQKEIGVYMGINILEDGYKDRLDKYIEIAKKYPNVLSIILESDPIDKLTESQIIEVVKYVKDKEVRISVASTPHNWNNMKNVLDEVDFPYYYMFDYWNGVSASQALVNLQMFHQQNIQTHDAQPVYELGYPGAGNVIGNANPSPEEQKKFIEGLSEFDGNYVLLSYSNEKQKFKSEFPENIAEQIFGIIENGKIKHNFGDIVDRVHLEFNIKENYDGTLEYTPVLIQDKSQSESMQEVMEIKMTSNNGNADVYYHDKQEHLQVVESSTIFLELDNYDDVKVISDSISSISFFLIPNAFAQCDLNSPTCVYLVEKSNYDNLEYVVIASMLIVFAFYVVIKFRLLSDLKSRKIKMTKDKETNGYFERMTMP